MATTKRTCTKDGCEREMRCRQMCQYHYNIWYKANPGAARSHRKTGNCEVPGCESDTKGGSLGFCSMHYQRVRSHGNPGEVAPRVRPSEWAIQDDGQKWRVCPGCEVAKPPSSFHKSRTSSYGGLSYYCRPCASEDARQRVGRDREAHLARRSERYWANVEENRRQSAERYKADPLAGRLYNWRAQGIDITAEQYKELHDQQSGCCAICGISEQESGRSLALDHCHSTNRVRGLLCAGCNVGLGFFQDRQDVLSRAIEYLSATR